ncbi:MAG: SDR family oxidoreductase [Planctomycetaceae bacterium]
MNSAPTGAAPPADFPRRLPGRLLITGVSGRLGRYAWRAARARGWTVVGWCSPRRSPTLPANEDCDWQAVDLAQSEHLAPHFERAQPTHVLHLAALSTVAGCLAQPDLATRVNVQASRELARLSRQAGARFLLASTDLVFGGDHAPCQPDDRPVPKQVYGRSKWQAEQAVLSEGGDVAVARLALLFGPSLGPGRAWFDQQLQALATPGAPLPLFVDEWRTPLDYATATHGLLDLLSPECGGGIWHLGGPERLSRWEMGTRLARHLACSAARFTPVPRAEIAAPEPRPADVSLDSSRWRSAFPHSPWPRYEEALGQLLPPALRRASRSPPP